MSSLSSILILFCPPDSLVHPLVLASRHDAQVAGVIVLLVAIDMMHHTAIVYLAANLLFGHPAVLVHPLPILIKELDIAVMNAGLGTKKEEIEKGDENDGRDDDYVYQHYFIPFCRFQ